MGNITFFARPYFIGSTCPPKTLDETYINRLSSQIRGEQIAHYIGGKYNPTEGFQDDLIIHVKPKRLDYVRPQDWVDFADGIHLLEPLKERPDLRIIAAAQNGYDYLKSRYPNEIILIPQQHLNWENTRRERKEVKIAGYIGGPSVVFVPHYRALERD